MLKEQGTEIHRQATETSVSVDTLKQAFADTMEALNDISTYKTEALPRLKQTISDFQTLVVEGESQIEKLEKASNITL